MKILIATALFPPDVAEPAPYVKELTKRLGVEHTVSVLTYGSLPEPVDGVSITAVPKNTSPMLRFYTFTVALYQLIKQYDVALIENAPSTELPAFFVSFFTDTKIFLQMSDTKIKYTGWRKFIHTLACSRLEKIEPAVPPARPEIISFKPYPTEAFEVYEKHWTTHTENLITTLNNS